MVSKGETNPLLSLLGLNFLSFLDFFLGLRPMYLFVIESTYFLCKHFILVFFWVSWCALDCKELSFKL